MNGFDWQEYLHTAEELFERVQNLRLVEMHDEALCRIGISRAYYAAFHAAADYQRVRADYLDERYPPRDFSGNTPQLAPAGFFIEC